MEFQINKDDKETTYFFKFNIYTDFYIFPYERGNSYAESGLP